VAGNGYRMGLALVIDAKVNDYSVTNGKFDGFKVIENSIFKINVFFFNFGGTNVGAGSLIRRVSRCE